MVKGLIIENGKVKGTVLLLDWRYDLNRLCWPMELSWMVWFILVKNNLEEEEQARVLAWSYRRFNCCRFWIRSNENRNASKSGWTFVGLLKMNEEGDAKPDKFSYSDVTPLVHQRSCHMTYTSLEVHDILREGLIVRQC
jgi:hypothetical protein